MNLVKCIMENKISVAVATYNGAIYLEEQLLSVINQSMVPDEIIIVDDFSKDSTVEIIERIKEKHGFIKLHRNETNIGPIETFKKAVSLCNYEYVALCDQDDVWYKNKVSEIKKYFSQNPKISIFAHNLELIGSHKGTQTFWDLKNFGLN